MNDRSCVGSVAILAAFLVIGLALPVLPLHMRAGLPAAVGHSPTGRIEPDRSLSPRERQRLACSLGDNTAPATEQS